MLPIEIAWARLLGRLEQVAPGTRAALLPPGSASAPAELLPVGLSPEVQVWFGLHNGARRSFDGQILPANTPLSLPEAVESTLLTRRIWQADEDHAEALAESDEEAGGPTGTWLDQYVMLAEDGSGGGLFVDLRPGDLSGCVRWWDKVDSDEAEEALAPSLAALLDAVADSLDSGEAIDGLAPVATDGVIEWQ